MKLRAFGLASLPLVLLLAACGGKEQPAPQAPFTPPPVAVPPEPVVEAPVEPQEPSLPDVAFGPTRPSEDPATPPRVQITAPKMDQVLSGTPEDFTIKLDVKNWNTHHGGPHVHLILDDRPYMAIWDPKEPIKLSSLLDAGETLSEGEHRLVAFASRANHESVKMKDAIAVVRFWVGKKGKSEWKPKSDPMLVYSRPKGTYNGSAADNVLVDWYVVNAKIGETHKVRATVHGPGIEETGRMVTVTEWRPLALDYLRNGDYTITLELLDPEGNVAPGAWNRTSRTITVNRDAKDAPAPSPDQGH